MIYFLSEIVWNLYLLIDQKLFDKFIDLSERKFEHIFAGQRREKMVTCRILI